MSASRLERFIDEHEPSNPGQIKSRIVFLPYMNTQQYNTFVGLADVVLDTFPVGGGRSSLEILATGTPIVVLYARTSILQLTSGFYRAMDMWRGPTTTSSNGSNNSDTSDNSDTSSGNTARKGSDYGLVANTQD